MANAYDLMRDARPYNPAFMYCQGTKILMLSYNKFLQKLPLTLNAVGLNTELYAGHSLRQGGSTFAMQCGVPVELIMIQGDWKSNAYERHLENSFQDTLKAVAKHAGGN